MKKDALSKSAWSLFEITKEITKKNLVSAVSSGQLKVEESVLPNLLNVIDASISEGYNKGHKNFLSECLKEETTTSKKKK